MSATNKHLAKPVWYNNKMWQEIFRVCVVIGVEQRKKVKGSRLGGVGSLYYCAG